MEANIYVLQTHKFALISHFSTLHTYVFNLLQIHC